MIHELTTYRLECDRCRESAIVVTRWDANYIIAYQLPQDWIAIRKSSLYLYCSEACKNAIP